MRKGMSQVLALIIAAAVLMTSALIIIFMVGDALPGVSEDIDLSGCQTVAETECLNEDETIDAPGICTDEDGQIPSDIADNVAGIEEDGTLDCGVY